MGTPFVDQKPNGHTNGIPLGIAPLGIMCALLALQFLDAAQPFLLRHAMVSRHGRRLSKRRAALVAAQVKGRRRLGRAMFRIAVCLASLKGTSDEAADLMLGQDDVGH